MPEPGISTVDDTTGCTGATATATVDTGAGTGCERLLEEDLENNSLYQALETKYSLQHMAAEQELEAGLAGNEEAHLLKIPVGSAVLFTRRTTYTERNQPIEYARSLYRGNKYTIYMQMKREQVMP